jgi:NTE family protein
VLLRKLNLFAILILTLFSPLLISGQKVGVVLSGGGGAAMAHIGVLKALEENNIPIDYITGSSMGALIGALYASGYSPLEIEAMVLSERFIDLTEGELDDQFSYYQRQQQYDPSYIRFRIKPDKPIANSIPTHIYNSQQLDFYLMTLFAGAEAASNYNFDSLMIPFRCVASDIYKKESVVFKTGNISESVRASMTYPFYLQAIEIDSVLLFDGGLYNNFPKNLMKETFKPDIIVGSNVSSNAKKPEEDNLFGQLENMLSEPTDYTIANEEGILFNINLDIGALDLSRIKESIDKGYEEATLLMDSLKTRLNSRMSENEFDKRRLNFNEEKVALHFESITISGLDKTQSNFIKASFGQVKDFNDLEKVERLYYKLYADDKIKFIFPKAKYNPQTGKYNLNLDILKEKNLEIQIGGILSTSPINTGYASFKYNIFNKTSLSIGLNGYFGNVYQSAKLNIVLDVPAYIPFYWEPYFCINDYDYFKNNVSVFDEVQPPYMVTNEIYIGNSIGFPFILNSIFSLDYKYFEQSYSYYINPDFSLKDDADNTQFRANTIGITIDKFNYNFRQYAFSGTKFYFNTRLITGWENTTYAFPTAEQVNNQSRRTWLEMHLEYSGYPLNTKFYSLGLLFEGYFSNMKDFTNYFGTIMEARQFEPLTESATLFQPNLRSTSWLAIGMKNVFKPMHNFQVRLEAYIFQPSWNFYAGPNGETDKGLLFDNRYLIISAAIVYHTKLGPVSLNGNYYQYLDPETSILLNFGFTIFNKNAKD